MSEELAGPLDETVLRSIQVQLEGDRWFGDVERSSEISRFIMWKNVTPVNDGNVGGIDIRKRSEESIFIRRLMRENQNPQNSQQTTEV